MHRKFNLVYVASITICLQEALAVVVVHDVATGMVPREVSTKERSPAEGTQPALFPTRAHLITVGATSLLAKPTNISSVDGRASAGSGALTGPVKTVTLAMHDSRDAVVPVSAEKIKEKAEKLKEKLANPWPRCSSISCYRVWLSLLAAILVMWLLHLGADMLLRDTAPQSRRFAQCAECDNSLPLSSSSTPSEMLGYLSISACGGLDKVHKLVPAGGSSDRYFWAIVTVLYGWFNACFILWTDSIFLGLYLGLGSSALESHRWGFEAYSAHSGNESWFSLDMAACVEVMELFGLALVLAMISQQVINFVWFRGSNSYVAFRSLEYAFDGLILLSYFSAIMPVGAVHPALVFRRFEQWMAAPPFGSVRSGKFVKACQVIFFWSSRLVLLVCGLLAFGAKITLVSATCSSPHVGKYWKMATLGTLMVQTLGSTVIHRVLKRELLWMIFGGQDVVVHCDEALMMDVYIARLYSRIWDVYWVSGRKLDFLVLCITIDHADIQKLLFEECLEEKSEVLDWLAANSVRGIDRISMSEEGDSSGNASRSACGRRATC